MLVEFGVVLSNIIDLDTVRHNEVDRVNLSWNEIVVQDFFPILVDWSLALRVSAHILFHLKVTTFPMNLTPFSMIAPMLKWLQNLQHVSKEHCDVLYSDLRLTQRRLHRLARRFP